MADILVATLGASPIIVTAMVRALREEKNIQIETLHILYPGEETNQLISLGYDLIAEHLQDVCQIVPQPLGFADAYSYEASIHFLRCLASVLDQYVRDNVYLSLAGGRKNMAALAAVISQFYPHIHGVYHLLDKYEYDFRKRNFFTIEELVDMSVSERKAKLNPPVNSLKLVEIPFTCFSNANELRRYFASERSEGDLAIETDGAKGTFYRAVFQPDYTTKALDVFLSETAYNQFQLYRKQGGDRLKTFSKCFRQMQDPQALQGYMHGTFSDSGKVFHYYKLRRTVERPFYYTAPNPIHLFPHQPVKSVIICGLSVEQENGTYAPTADELLAQIDFKPYKHLYQLMADETVLIVPLGQSPMIATQTYILLQEEYDLKVSLLVVIYPAGHAPIRNSANRLADLCRQRQIPLERKPIRELRDVDSYEACQTYAQALRKAIEEVRLKHPYKQIALSLSGGRKGMSVLALYAAQFTGIEQVYHTLITDPALEARVERECNLDALNQISLNIQAQRLFLEKYDQAKFVLFPIPVVPLDKIKCAIQN